MHLGMPLEGVELKELCSKKKRLPSPIALTRIDPLCLTQSRIYYHIETPTSALTRHTLSRNSSYSTEVKKPRTDSSSRGSDPS